MENEFDKIMEFFNLPPEEKDNRLQEVFEDALAYFERFRSVMIHGSPEEKKEALEKVMQLKTKIEEETKRVCEKTGLTPDQLMAYSNDPKNFSSEQWKTIQETKKKLSDSIDSLKGVKKPSKLNSDQDEKEPHKKRFPPKNWIQP